MGAMNSAQAVNGLQGTAISRTEKQAVVESFLKLMNFM